MAVDTKPNLNSGKFEQLSGDTLNLSGTTNVFKNLSIRSGATFTISPNAGNGKTLTSNNSGNATWTTPIGWSNLTNGSIVLGCGTPLSASTICQNTIIGGEAGKLITTGIGNIAIGYQSLYNNNCEYNVGIGYQSLYTNSSGCGNVGIGYKSGYNNTTGSDNVALGTYALSGNCTGWGNIAIGSYTLYKNKNNSGNIALGTFTLCNNTTGYMNYGIGQEVLSNNISGANNIGMGYLAVYHNETGCYNIGIGSTAICLNHTGSHNIGIGREALLSNYSGGSNISIGNYNSKYSCNGSNNIGLGNCSLYSNSDGHRNIAIGNNALYSVYTGCDNVAIGNYAGYTETGCNKLHIANNSTSSLIYGEFDNRIVTINGNLNISGVTTGLYTDSALVWNSATCQVKKVPFMTGSSVSWSSVSSKPSWLSATTLNQFQSDHTHTNLIGTSTFSNYTGTTAPAQFVPYTTVNYAKDYTGFIDGSNINVSYNYTNRTITLTGDLSYMWRGQYKTLTSPWTSTGHTGTVGQWFLSTKDGTNFIWRQTAWLFEDMQVAYLNYKSTSGATFAVRETHELMDWHAHEEFHQTTGTYLGSGGQVTALSYTVNTATDNSVKISFDAAIIEDEDLFTLIPAWNKLSGYTTMYISGSTSVFNTAATHPFIAAGVNQFIQVNTVSTGAMTAGATNRWFNVYQILIPTTSDNTSKKYRMIMLQPQVTYTSLAAAQAEDTRGLSLGSLSIQSAEYVIYSRITYATANGNVNYGRVTIPTGGITYVVGSKMSQVSVAGISSTNHANLSNLSWVDSGHIDSANALAGFNSSGVAETVPKATFSLSGHTHTTSYVISGNSSATGFTVNHSKNNQFVMVEIVKDVSPYQTIYTGVSRPNTNCVCVTFDTAPVNGCNYRVIVTG